MIFQTFRKKLLDEKASVEFIESVVVLSVILLMISLLIIISLMTIYTIRDGEIAYSKSLDYIYDEQLPNFSSLSKSDMAASYKFVKSNHIFSQKVKLKKNQSTQNHISRVNTEDFLRKVDFVNEVIEKVEQKTGFFSNVRSKLAQHKDSIQKFIGANK